MKRFWLPALVAAATMLPGLASAHPHVWVTTRSAFVVDAAGRATAIRQAWTFDEMFSAYAVQGLDANGDGKYSREELQSLAETNVTTMAESDYFTFADADGAEIALTAGKEYWLEYDGTQLTLHFTLALAKPVALGHTLKVEIVDPEFFVDFAMAEKDPASLASAHTGCNLKVERPKGALPAGQLSEDFFNSLESQNYGEQFANRIILRCAA